MRGREGKLPRVVYEDSYLLALDKPSGWTVLHGSGKRTPLQNWLLEEKLVDEFNQRTGIIHRLDKETSGLLLVARIPLAFQRFQKMFKKREIKKEYLALVHGKVPRQGQMRAPVGRDRQRRRFKIVPGGRWGETKFWRQQIYRLAGEYFSLVKVEPTTGRSHQIRLHFKYLGFPLAGDPLYGVKKDRCLFPRLFLHASRLVFFHPFLKKKVTLRSPLPNELKEVLHD